jgi:hypothetical protein
VPDFERILQNTPGTLSQQWYEDGVAVDAGTVTVGITRADGTVLVAALTGTSGTGASPRTFSLTTTHTALLDRLKVTWTSSAKGTQVSYVEVVGGFLFTINQARALSPLSNTTTYPTARIAEARILVEQTIEDACGRAFVPRYTLETLSGTGTTDLMLKWPDLRSIRSVTVTTSGVGAAYTEAELALVAINTSGRVYNTGQVWALGAGNISVGYEHGPAFPPARVTQAALTLARAWLVKGPVDDRALGVAAPDGGFGYGLAVPGRNGAWTGVPEVDAVIDQYNMRAMVA